MMTELEKLKTVRSQRLKDLERVKRDLAYYKEQVEETEKLLVVLQQDVNALNAKIVEAELRWGE